MQKYILIPLLLSFSFNHFATDKNSFAVESIIKFRPVSGHKDGKLTLELEFTTFNEYPCVNYNLVIDSSVKNNDLTVKFIELNRPDICFTAIGPATASLEIPNNIKTMTFINGTATDIYSIVISKERIETKMKERNFTILSSKEILR